MTKKQFIDEVIRLKFGTPEETFKKLLGQLYDDLFNKNITDRKPLPQGKELVQLSRDFTPTNEYSNTELSCEKIIEIQHSEQGSS